MKVNYDPETLRTTLWPESEDERRAIVKMLQVFATGGTITVAPDMGPKIDKSKFVRWAKTHKRRRIAKKWHKRYGPIMGCLGVMFDVAAMDFFGKKTPRQLLCCPCFKAMLDKEIAQ